MGRNPIITLTTDFGVADGYVGMMKGVIFGIVPDARLVDIRSDMLERMRLEAHNRAAAAGRAPLAAAVNE